MARFYVTTPIYYVNDLPHIGHIYTTVVADAFARYHRLAGDEVYFLTGTDEHGQNIERAARREGVSPLALADRVVERYHQLWEQLAISHDDFIRTTEERHRRGVAEIIRRIEANGDLYLDRHEGWYCSPCEAFYTEKELLPGNLCPIHELPVERHAEENVFFRLSRYQERLLAWYDSPAHPAQPETRANEVRTFVASGLKDLSVSRATLEWGIPFPGHRGHTVYVWLDALTNYVSALGYGRPGEEELYRRFWEEGDVRLHLIGKDILRQHAVYWPAFLMSAGLPLPTAVFAHGFWLRDARKISKSVGNVVRPDALMERFGADPLRYFLLREMAFGQDAGFSDEAFIDRYNSDLANDLGNSASRLITLAHRAFGGRTPPVVSGEGPLPPLAAEVARDYHLAMAEPAPSRALESLWRLLAETNQYLVAEEPWRLLGDADAQPRLARVLYAGLEAVRIVAVGLLPFMPRAAAAALAAVGSGVPPESFAALAWGGTPTGAELPAPAPLFPRIDKAAYVAEVEAGRGEPRAAEQDPRAESEEETMISIERFFETELKVATVTAAEAIPKSNKLLKLTVDLGGESRTLVAGIAQQYAPEALVGRQVVVVANLQPATLMGVESQGMVLAASVGGVPVLLRPESEVPAGTRVR
jgi:methionyl-tRNA synthetase